MAKPSWTYAIKKKSATGEYLVFRNDSKVMVRTPFRDVAVRVAQRFTTWANQPWGVDIIPEKPKNPLVSEIMKEYRNEV